MLDERLFAGFGLFWSNAQAEHCLDNRIH